MKVQRPYRQFLKGVVSTRKRLIRTGDSRRKRTHFDSTIMYAEQLLMRMPSEASVKAWIQRNADRVRDLIPAQSPDDKRLQTLNTILNG